MACLFAAALLFIGTAQAVQTPKIAAMCIGGAILIVLAAVVADTHS